MRTVLVLSPYFPPMGVVGAKRPLMLARNLPRFGWRPVVLAADPARENLDESLAEMVPDGVVVSRRYGHGLRRVLGRGGPERAARPRERRLRIFGRDLPHVAPIEDPYLVDAPAAIREGLRLARVHGARAIHVCADPWSAVFAGLFIRRRTGLPLVVDCRDPWALHPGRRAWRPAPTQWAIEALELCAFRGASKVVLNTEDCHAAYVERYRGRLPPERFTWIRNAFDPGLFRDAAPEKSGAFVVLHFGWFRRLVPSRPLFEAFARFVRREALGPDAARLRCLGGLRPEDEEVVRRLDLGPWIEARPPVPYRDARAALVAADVLAMVVGDESRLCVPSKLYDYLAARRPILALSANPEVDRIVAGAGAGLSVPILDADGAAAALGALRARPPRAEPWAVRPFEAAEQSRRFAAVLDEVTAS